MKLSIFGITSILQLNIMCTLFVADVAGVSGAPEPARRPGGAVPTADRLRVPPPLPQPSYNACRPGSQGLVWLPPGKLMHPHLILEHQEFLIWRLYPSGWLCCAVLRAVCLQRSCASPVRLFEVKRLLSQQGFPS
jgi:hypothetical protein